MPYLAGAQSQPSETRVYFTALALRTHPALARNPIPIIRPAGCAPQLPGPGCEVDDCTPSAPRMSRGEAGLSLSVYVALTYIPSRRRTPFCVFCEREAFCFLCAVQRSPLLGRIPWLVGLYAACTIALFLFSWHT